MFPNDASEFVYTRTYSRWLEEEKRREFWPETVQRYLNFIKDERGALIPPKVLRKMEEKILNFEVMPSMRALWAAGPAMKSDNLTSYNCSFSVIDNIEAFSEALYILMCVPRGTLVDTEFGPKEIEKIKENDQVWSFNHNKNQKELKKVLKTHKINVKKENQIKIKTVHGEFVCSNKHEIPIYKNNKWIYTLSKNLKIGDIVQKLNHWEDNDLIFNEKAWWTGAFLGDGCYNFFDTESLRIRMSGDNENVINKFVSISSKLSKESVTYNLSNNNLYSVPVWITEKTYNKTNFLTNNFFDLVGDIPQQKCKVIKIPDWIKKETDKNVFLSFLAGLIDTDGNVTTENKIQIATSSPFLKDDLIYFLNRFAIPNWYNEILAEEYNSTGYKPTGPMYKITFPISAVRGIDKFISHDIKKARISDRNNDRKWWSKRKIILPEEEITNHEKFINPKQLWHFKKQLKKKGYVGEGYWKGYIPKELYKYDRIISIETNQNYNEEFCDLTVENNHNYYAGFKNYYLVHNCGTGYGFSVEKKYVDKLPIVPNFDSFKDRVKYIVLDNKAGWADSVKFLIENLYQGVDVNFDYSEIRPKGARLITMGGRASGPDPLVILHSFIREIFNKAQGRKLYSLECHDILNQIAEAVIVAGVRRSSELSMSDLDDKMMRDSKIWPFPPRRYMANNSAVYYKKPTAVEFLNEWSSLASSGTGERGIVNLYSARNNAPKRRNDELIFGTNPCQPGFATVVTKNGTKTFDELQIGDEVEFKNYNFTKVINKWKTGIKDVYCYTTNFGNIFIGTNNHRILTQSNDKIEVEKCYISEIPIQTIFRTNEKFVAKHYLGKHEVYDITVEHKDHVYNTGGIIVSNCGEIQLRNKGLCNLSEVVIRHNDDMDDLLEKVETATWIGAIQSTFTYFPYLSKEWEKNCKEERLLGVSLTGQMDNPKILGEEGLRLLKAKAIKVAKKASEILKINMPTAITCTKPSGTVSQLVDSASGIHPRFAKYYIRRYRISANDPLFKMIRDQGIKVSPENGQEDLPEDKISTYVVSFPIKAPKGSIIKDDMTAIEQLEWYKKIQTNWCEHNASMTVYVKDEEWFEVGNWVYQNMDIINGVSFLPFDGGKYKQAPYEEITEEKYNKLMENFKQIDYSQLSKYEQEDNTEGSKSLACTSDKCDIT